MASNAHKFTFYMKLMSAEYLFDSEKLCNLKSHLLHFETEFRARLILSNVIYSGKFQWTLIRILVW